MAITASCHCGDTRFEVAEVPAFLLRCNCSFCAKRGALWAYYEPDKFRLLSTPAAKSTYRWNRKKIGLNFCGTCGCTTYNDSFNWQTGAPEISVNALLFDDFDIGTVAVEEVDGRTGW